LGCMVCELITGRKFIGSESISSRSLYMDRLSRNEILESCPILSDILENTTRRAVPHMRFASGFESSFVSVAAVLEGIFHLGWRCESGCS
jgi:hypothetical protein